MFHNHAFFSFLGLVCVIFSSMAFATPPHDFSPVGGIGRVGSLPFPGGLTNFVADDFTKLGPHSHAKIATENRGNLYTSNGGFLDLAHVRDCADSAADLFLRILPALQARQDKVEITGGESNVWILKFNYPKEEFTKDEAIEVAIQISLEVAHQMGLFHEMASWFGLSISVPALGYLPGAQMQSAFTYEDMYSHAVGLAAVEKALRDPVREFDEAMTYYLDLELQSLRPVSPAVHAKAAQIAKVQGWWRPEPTDFTRLWRARSQALYRPIDEQLLTELTPSLVPDLEECKDAQPKSYPVPRLKQVAGKDLSQFLSIEIGLGLEKQVAENIRKSLGDEDREFISPSVDFPVLLRNIKKEMEAQGISTEL